MSDVNSFLQPRQNVVSRRATIISDLADFLPQTVWCMSLGELVPFETGCLRCLSPPASGGRLAAEYRASRGGLEVLSSLWRAGRAARGGNLALRRGHSAGRCHCDWPVQDVENPRDRLRQSNSDGAGRCYQSFDSETVGPEGFFYAPDPSSQLALPSAATYCHEFRRRSLPEIRCDDQQSAGRQDGADWTELSSSLAASIWIVRL